jgi:hypothetical protein
MAFFAGCLLCYTLGAVADAEAEEPDSDRGVLLAWLDGLELPDVRDGCLVRLTQREVPRLDYGESLWGRTEWVGVLLPEGKGILLPTLRVLRVAAGGRGDSAGRGYERLGSGELGQVVRRVSASDLLPVVAWMVVRTSKGEDGVELGHEILKGWNGLPGEWRHDRLGSLLRDDWVARFSDESVSWVEQARRAEWMADNVLSGASKERMLRDVAVLRGMGSMNEVVRPGMGGDSEHSRRVSGLLLELCNEQHDWRRGFVDVLERRPGGVNRARELAEIGYEAIPFLIRSLEDERFTRSVECGGWSFDDARPHVLRVGDVVLAVLERLSGRVLLSGVEAGTTRVYERTEAGRILRRVSSRRMVEGGHAPGVRRMATEWWGEVKRQGLERWLSETVSTGGEGVEVMAAALLRSESAAGLRAVRSGFIKSQDADRRAVLVEMVWSKPGEEATRFLRQVSQGGCVRSRVVAARGLWRRGETSAGSVIVESWFQLVAGVGDDWQYEGKMIIRNLLALGDRKLFQSLKESIPGQSKQKRWVVLDVLREGGLAGEGEWQVEELLLQLLRDGDSSRRGTNVLPEWNGYRICDDAGELLARFWPEKYVFEMDAKRPTRDAMISVIRRRVAGR